MSIRGNEVSSLNPKTVEYLRSENSGLNDPESTDSDWAEHRPNEKGRGRYIEKRNGHVPGRKVW